MSKDNTAVAEGVKLHASQVEVFDTFDLMLETHIPGPSDKLDYLPRHPNQLSHHVVGQPQPMKNVLDLASLADPRYPAIQKKMFELVAKKSGVITELGDHIGDGGNVVFATNHGELTDVALLFAAFNVALSETKYANLFEKSHVGDKKRMNRGIVVSQIVGRIGLDLNPPMDPMPATTALGFLCDDVWKSFPNTETMKEMRKTAKGMIWAKNRLVKKEINQKLDDGRYFLAMAPSGSKDKPLSRDKGPLTYILQALYDGTIDMMTHQNDKKEKDTRVLFLTSWLNGKDPIIDVVGSPGNWLRLIETSDDAHDIMDDAGDLLSHRVEGTNFRYQRPRAAGKRLDKGIVTGDY